MAKTDNHNPKVKLDLRRRMLDIYHVINPPHVFDCCQGSSVMWSQLRSEYLLASYWGVDLKPKKGRMKIDSNRILSQPGGNFDLIDVDTYGSPWKHWTSILKNSQKPCTVFLTIGSTMHKGSTDKECLRVLGLGELRIPESFCRKLDSLSFDAMLAQASQYGTIVNAIEAVSIGNARYVGLRFDPKKDLPAVATTGRSKQKRTKKESANV